MAIKIHTGLFKAVVKFEKNVPVDLASGLSPAKKDVYSEFLTTRGFLEDPVGSRRMQTADITMDNSAKLWVRYQVALFNELNNDANKALRVVVSDRAFTIVAWKRVEEKNFFIRFELNEQR
jgi:hypothetical protein